MIDQQLVDSNSTIVPFVIDTTKDLGVQAVDTVKKDTLKKTAKKSSPKPKNNLQSELAESAIKIDSSLIQHKLDSLRIADSLMAVQADVHLDLNQLTDLGQIKYETIDETLFQPKTFNTAYSNNWPVYVIIFILTLIGLTRAFNRKRFNEYISSFFSRKFAIQITRNEKIYTHRANIFLLFAWQMTISLMLVQITLLLNIESSWSPFALFLIGNVLISAIYLFKIFIHKILSFILGIKPLIDEYVFNILLHNKIIVLAIIPFVIFSVFGIEKYQAGALSIATFILLSIIFIRILKGIQIGLSHHVKFIHLFLYLCTLEILPLIIVSKILFF